MNYTTTTLGLAICKPAALLARALRAVRRTRGLALAARWWKSRSVRVRATRSLKSRPSRGHRRTATWWSCSTPTACIPCPRRLLSPAKCSPTSDVSAPSSRPPFPWWRACPAARTFPWWRDEHDRAEPPHLLPPLHGRLVAFRPRGVSVPERCPREGFPFAADFTFIDGTQRARRQRSPARGITNRRARRDGDRDTLEQQQHFTAPSQRRGRLPRGRATPPRRTTSIWQACSLARSRATSSRCCRWSVGSSRRGAGASLRSPAPCYAPPRVEALSKGGNIEGAALFATLVPAVHRRTALRALVAFQTAYNYLDALSERPSEDPSLNGEQLHRALLTALNPGAGAPGLLRAQLAAGMTEAFWWV